jgi:hypothetical protein
MTILPPQTAFNPGSQIWFVPDLHVSSWTRELDWYLGFQLFHSLSFQPKSVPEKLNEIIAENPISIPQRRSTSGGVLALAISDQLPAENLVVVSEVEQEDWLATCHRIWTKANSPMCRLFLPAAMSPQHVERVWKNTDGVTVVLNR